jgi:hypothetical protein
VAEGLATRHGLCVCLFAVTALSVDDRLCPGIGTSG